MLEKAADSLFPDIVSRKTEHREEDEAAIDDAISPEPWHDPKVLSGDVRERGDEGIKR